MNEQATTWQDVLDLVTRLDESGLADAEITMPGVQVRVSRGALAPSADATSATGTPVAPPTAPPATPPEQSPVAGVQHHATTPEAEAGSAELVDITAPMLGVTYLRPSPDAAPFVAVGDKVEPDTTVAVMEVMKLMNNVPAGVSGQIVEICAEDGAMAEYATVLFRVDPA